MNKLKSFVVVLATLILAASCSKEEPVIEYLDVTANNIAGSWKLVKWNGEDLKDGSYFYIDFVRADKLFTIYQNFDSMSDYPHEVTGRFNLENELRYNPDIDDVEDVSLIHGMYDYDEGFWAHKYEVRKLTSDSMEWVAKDDPTFVQQFVRSSVPAFVK
jgi:hypothetical protein